MMQVVVRLVYESSILIGVGAMGESYVMTCGEEVEDGKGGEMRRELPAEDPEVVMEERMVEFLAVKESSIKTTCLEIKI